MNLTGGTSRRGPAHIEGGALTGAGAGPVADVPLTHDDLVVLGKILARWMEGGADIGCYFDLGPHDLLLDGTIALSSTEHDALSRIRSDAP